MLAGEAFADYRRKLGLRDRAILTLTWKLSQQVRRHFGARYLRGIGMEIGAQANPLSLPPDRAHVQYVDRVPAEDQRRLHGLAEATVPVDVYAEADDLRPFPDNSVDFVIANHILEHTVDPIGAVKEWARVLKLGGRLFLTVPNYRGNQYDFRRTPPLVKQLEKVHAMPAEARTAYKLERWTEFVSRVDDLSATAPEYQQRVKQLVADDD